MSCKWFGTSSDPPNTLPGEPSHSMSPYLSQLLDALLQGCRQAFGKGRGLPEFLVQSHPRESLSSSISREGASFWRLTEQLLQVKSVSESMAVAACSKSLSEAEPKSESKGSEVPSNSRKPWASADDTAMGLCSSSLFLWASFSFWNFFSISLTLKAPEYFFSSSPYWHWGL